MKLKIREKVRKFFVGLKHDIELSDCGEIHLDPNEQVTFSDEVGNEYDVCKKDWGYYATPSLNGRLENFNFYSALVMNKNTFKKYIMLVHKDKVHLFDDYCNKEDQEVIFWLNKIDL